MIPWEISINNPTHETGTTGNLSGTDHSAADSGQPESSQQQQDDRWTIKRLLDWTADYFRDSGFDQPRLDAEVLLADAIGCQRIELYTRFDEEPSDEHKAIFRDWVARHVEGEPVAYLAGHREFFSLKFQVNSSVLIPRPETEHLVTEALDIVKTLDLSQPVHVVDVGTGSGCVAITICKHASDIQMVACDISEEALEVAKQNADIHDVRERISFVTSNLFDGVGQPAKFQLIVSNPPYIGLSERDDLDQSVIGFEPHEALFSTGPDGTETIERLIKQSSERLAPGGWFLFEISPMIADRCKSLVQATDDLVFEKFVNDLAGHKRIVVTRRRSD